jgi:hypothetical protein
MAFVSAADGATQLEALTRGLLFVSEADHPFQVTRLDALAELDEQSLLRALGKPADLPVTRLTLEAFFARAVEDQPWHGPTERAVVRRFRELLGFLATSLEQPRVVRVGSIQISAYALGKTSDGHWLGVATTLIET